MTFGETERLTPDEARHYIEDLTRSMEQRAWRLHQQQGEDCDLEPPEDDSDPSLQKQLYGEAWTFLYGIAKGVDLMKQGSKRELTKDGVGGWQIDDGDWQEHYDQYGYGEYGKGLEIGKRLAFYEDNDFTFSSGEGLDNGEAGSASENEFEFTDYSDE